MAKNAADLFEAEAITRTLTDGESNPGGNPVSWPRLFGFLFLLGCQPIGELTAFAATLQSNASARYGSGNTTIGSDGVSGFNLPNDGSTGIQMAQNTHLKTAAVGKSTLSHGAIGAASAWIGASVIDFPPSGGTNWNLFAGAHTRFIDDIEVTSASLPVGTEVPILFSLHVSSSINAAHSALPGGSNNRAFVRQMIDAGTVGPGGNRFDVEAEDNNAFRDTTGSVPNQNNGLLNPNTPHLDYLFDAKVGDTLTFFVLIDSDVIGNLSPITVSTNPVVLDNATGQALGSIGVAFGASPINPDMSPNTDVILMSQQFGGPFSPSSSASAANAALGEPANPIPEPSSLLIAVAGLLVVVFRRLVLLLRSD